ncbi:MAG: glycosyl transferase, partial [Pseudomonadota bacterium]
GQALLSHAYANWAVAAYIGGLLAVVPFLLTRHRGWLWATVGLHGAFALLIPVATAFGTGWTAGPDHRLLLARYLGRAEMSAEIFALARETGLPIVADDRDVLADLFYSGRDTGLAVFARPEAGRPPNHYVQKESLPAEADGDVLLITRRRHLPERCAAETPVARLAPPSGAYRDRPQTAWRVPAACLLPGG